MNRIRQLLSEATNAFGRLSARERTLVALAIGAVLAFAVFVSSFSFSKAVSARNSRIKTKIGQLQEASALTATYRQAETQRADLERRLKANNTRLFTHVDELSKKLGVEIGGITDKGTQPLAGKIVESAVEVTFTRTTLDKLIKFISAVEGQTGLVKVTKLQIRPRTDQPVIDAWLVVATYSHES
mgnify:CR=1 FL=1|jgi:uncharacterized membrane protein